MEFFSEGIGLNIVGGSLLLILVCLQLGFRFSNKKQFAGQTIIPSLMAALSIFFLAITFSFPAEEVGPSMMPRMWIFWLLILSIAILVLCAQGKSDVDPKTGRIGFFLTGVAILIGYFFAIIYLGYFISSFIFLAVLMYVLSCRKPITILSICIGWTAFSYLIFYKLLYIQLPLGFLENYL